MAVLKRRTAKLTELKPHPQNYRTHTEVQIEHLCASITEHGLYRNIVVANDGATILAGHGVVLAAARLGLIEVPIIAVPWTPFEPRALKLLIGDNEIARRADVDDRALSDMLKSISDEEFVELLGTGFDTQQLAALVMVTRTAAEVADINAAAEWVGMPELGDAGPKPLDTIVRCATEADREAFFAFIGADSRHITGTKVARAVWWPLRERVRRQPRVEEETGDVVEAPALPDLHPVEGTADLRDGALLEAGGDAVSDRG